MQCNEPGVVQEWRKVQECGSEKAQHVSIYSVGYEFIDGITNHLPAFRFNFRMDRFNDP
jgi:hypothetical protein